MANTISETITENIFRNFYGTNTFIEKSAIPKTYAFKSKRGTNYKGYPDFFLDMHNEGIVIVVEAKAIDHDLAENETRYYMQNNKINGNIIGMAVSGQSVDVIRITYFYKLKDSNKIYTLSPFDSFLTLDQITKAFYKAINGDVITDDELNTILSNLNTKFQYNNIKDTDRSLFFSALMIALKNNNFKNTYQSIQIASDNERMEMLESHYMNEAVLNAVTIELRDKITNPSKKYSWQDRFAFIRNVDIPLSEYKSILELIEKKIYQPFQNDEKQDLLGKAYKIFLKKAGKVDNKNIILTPDHIKHLMVRLARLNKDDVVLDTCMGSGGFLMEAMETMIRLSNNDPQKIKKIKEKQLIGFETDPVLFSLACSNMFLHGDGRTNMYYGSSLLSNDPCEKKLKEDIKSLKPTKIIINPPYESNKPIKFVESAIDYLEPNGKLIIIMPNPTLTKNTKDSSKNSAIDNSLTHKILSNAKLDFVIKMPDNLFKEQDRSVYTSIFGFTKTPHDKNDEVLFCELSDDGLVSVQHRGRVDKYGVWQDKENFIINTIFNQNEVDGFSEKREIFVNNDIIPYGISKKQKILSENFVKFSEIFDTSVKGELQSEDCNSDGDYTFITAAAEWKKHDSYQKDCEAIIYAVRSQGSLGRAHYYNVKFIASYLCQILTPANNEKYPVDLEFYSYYLMSIRKQIISDLADGASKLSIKVNPDLDNYLIEYFPYDKQIEFKEEIKRRIIDINNVKAKLKTKEENLYSIIK